MTGRRAAQLIVVGMAVATLGCVTEYPEDLDYGFTPIHRKDGTEKVIVDYENKVVSTLVDELRPIFGTPANPTVNVDDAIVSDPEMQLEPEKLKRGSQVYRNLCLTCHGLNGDGTGPTGEFLNPKPRDFRKGYFKFRSTAGTYPAREDIMRTLQNGIPHGQMPSFALLPQEDLEALASYVIHLSLRGIVQERAAVVLAQEDFVEMADEVEMAAQQWLESAKNVYQPTLPPDGWVSFAQKQQEEEWNRGRELYLGAGACSECHGASLRPSPMEPANRATNLGRLNEWGDPNYPRELAHGYYHGGSAPIDIFRRIKLGVIGADMPGANTQLSDDDIWHIVGYVLSVPGKGM